MKHRIKITPRRGLLTLFLLAASLVFAAGCTPDKRTETALQKENSLASTQTESLSPTPTKTPAPTVIPTIAPTITANPIITPTPDALLDAIEQISLFSTYDDFTGSFDPTQWDIEEPDENNPFSYSSENGYLTVQMNPDQFGYTHTAIYVPSTALSSNINGASITLPYDEKTDGQSPHGLRLELTNGKNQWIYTCTYHLDSTNFSCELEDAASHTTLYNSHNISVSQYIDLSIQVEWIPETGLLLTFLNGQLVDYQNLAVIEPISAEKVGLFVSREGSYASGNIVFSNFRIGTYQETVLNLPDDLLPHWENQYLASSDNIDFYLYDDFDQPLYDGYIDLQRWKLHYDEEKKENAGNKTVFGQQDGKLVLEGTTDVILIPTQVEKTVRSIQVDFIPQDAKYTDRLLVLSLSARQAASENSYGQLIYEYACRIESINGDDRGIFCGFYGSSDNDKYYSSASMPIDNEETTTVNVSYDEATGSFMLFLNGSLADQIHLEDRFRQTIDQQGLMPWIQVNQSQKGKTVLDNVAIGIKSDQISETPTTSNDEVVAVLPHSDLYPYDDFDDPQFDGRWQNAKWDPSFHEESNTGLFQMDGTLRVDEFPQGVKGAWMLISKGYYQLLDQYPTAAQIEFGPQPDAYNEYVGFSFSISAEKFNQYWISKVPSQNDLEYNRVSCGVNYLGYEAFLECGVCFESSGCVDYNDTSILDKIAIDPFNNHTLALEYDQNTNTYYAYLDHQRVAEFQSSANPFTRHTFVFQGGTNEGSGASLNIDNVLVGIPAENPEALTVPEESLLPIGLDGALQFMPIVETSAYTQFFSPYNLSLGIHPDFSGFSIDGDYEETQDNLLMIPEGTRENHQLVPKLTQDSFTLSQINAASITLEPVDSAPYGWQTELALDSEEENFHFRCFLHDETQDSYFACQGYDEGREQGYYSDPVTIDPNIQHQFSFEAEPDTYLFHVKLDGNYVFDVDVTEYADLSPDTRYQTSIMIDDLEGESEDYKMRLVDYWLGKPNKD